MCGIAALQLKNDALFDTFGALMDSMLCEIVDRGPDSAGIALYDEPLLNPVDESAVTLLNVAVAPDELKSALTRELPEVGSISVEQLAATTVVSAAVETGVLSAALSRALPDAQQIGLGEHVVTLKGTGNPMALSAEFDLAHRKGTHGVSHTRMATESAVTASGSHPFTVDDDLCLVHNGSFSNHATIRKQLERKGITFDSQNDSEVAARYISWRMGEGDSLTEALEKLQETFDGFYTLVVTTANSMAVLRDPIACKPAIIAETDNWVAMASEYRALAGLPGVDQAELFEPEPGRIYTWTR